jgi:hypothetical protein
VSLPINTLLEEQKGEVILLSKQVVDSIIAEKREKFNKQAHLMNLTELALSVKPLLGSQGWKDYKEIAELRAKHAAITDPNRLARFLAIIRISYEVYAGPESKNIEEEETGGIAKSLLGGATHIHKDSFSFSGWGSFKQFDSNRSLMSLSRRCCNVW